MMRDINRLTGDKKIPAAPISIAMAFGYIGTAVCLLLDNQALPSDSLFWIEAVGDVLRLVAFSSFALSIVLVYREMLRLNGRPSGFGRARSLRWEACSDSFFFPMRSSGSIAQRRDRRPEPSGRLHL